MSSQVIASEKRAEAARVLQEELGEDEVHWDTRVSPTQNPASQLLESSDSDDLPQGEAFNPQVWPPLPPLPRGEKQPMFSRIEECEEDEDADEIVEHHNGYQNDFRKRLSCDEDYEASPNLHEYFAQFPYLSKASIIAHCRTHANALAVQVKTEREQRVQNPYKTPSKKITKRK